MSELVFGFALVVLFLIMAGFTLMYRHDANAAADRRARQNEQWVGEREQILKLLASTEKLLGEQQNHNSILTGQNTKLADRIGEIQGQFKSVTDQNTKLVTGMGEIQGQLKSVTEKLETAVAELKAVKSELTRMTKRAQKAEEHIEDID